MLAFYFFSLVFSSILWLIYILSYINGKLGSATFSSLGLTDMTVFLALILLPLFILWMIFGHINQYITSRSSSKNFKSLFIQMKKNQDYTDLLARVLIEAEQQIKNGFALNRFDLLIADMNELLSEIIQSCGFASKEQIEHLWVKIQNGGKWAFAKVIIEVSQNQPNFSERLFDKARRNLVLSGTIMEFCARYLSVVELLERHDQEKIFYNILETGVMGKVFSILSPVAKEIQKDRDFDTSSKQIRKQEIASNEPLFQDEKAAEKKSILGFMKRKKEDAAEDEDVEEDKKDAFSIALEKSFTSEPPLTTRAEPAFDSSDSDSMPTPVVSKDFTEEETLTNTQKTLNNLKKEWQDMKSEQKNNSLIDNEESASFSYPFSGWTDEENYRR